MSSVKEIIKFAGLEVHFHLDETDTAKQFTMFKCVIAPGAKMGVPHYHEAFDEAIYGLTGITTYQVDGKVIELAPGQHLFIPRSIVHSFVNNHAEPSEFLTFITPGLLGPGYFREIATVLNAGGPPDIAKLKEILLKYGLVPVMQPAGN